MTKLPTITREEARSGADLILSKLLGEDNNNFDHVVEEVTLRASDDMERIDNFLDALKHFKKPEYPERFEGCYNEKELQEAFDEGCEAALIQIAEIIKDIGFLKP